ncbi:MAG: DUF3667 domain-containing protein [Flavobacteriaceae bacterium]
MECGAKVIKNRLTFKNLAQDINDQFFNIDNTFLKTFIHLFTKPEIVINGFISGTRKKYITVIQYFAISLTLVGVQIFLMNTFFKDALQVEDMFGASFKDMPNQENNPFLPQNFDYSQINNYQSLIYILSVPFSAIATWLAYKIIGDKRFNFTEHIVLNLYYSGQIIIVSSVLTILFLCFGIDYMTITYIVTAITFIYFFHVLMRVFNSNFLNTLASFLLFLVVLGVIFLIVFILGVIIGIGIVLMQKI